MKKSILIISVITLLSTSIFSQNKTFQLDADAAFVPNLGQFDARDWQSDKIEYGYNHNPFYVFFTKKGVTYRFDRIVRNPKRDKKDPNSAKRTNISELIHATWVGSNPDVQIIAEEQTDFYFNYGVRKERYGAEQLKGINGFKKLTYKNLYDNIDLVYVFHPEGGIKYSLVVHPGGDPSQVRVKYSFDKTNVREEKISMQLNSKGQIEFNTSLAQLIEHAPYTFDKATNQEVSSKYKLENGEMTFELGNYDPSHTIVIDPWVISPTFTTSTAVWEVETDGVGNVYSIGGETPMELKKFNAAGALQWTYVTPWDTASVWLGTLATDNVGNSYITSGTTPEIERVDAAGNMIWHNNNSGFSVEYWSITFNCDKTKLIVGGTGATGIFGGFQARIYDIDITDGSVNTFQVVGTQGGGLTPVEVRSISSSVNAKYIYLTHTEVGAINQNLGACPTTEPVYQVDNTEHLGYKCENYLPVDQNGGGLKALVANDQYFYTHAGDIIIQWDLFTGALIGSANIPGGVGNAAFGGVVVQNSGLAVDDCGNVYVGSKNQVHKYDPNLNLLSSAAVSIDVYDVSVNANGEVIACGAQSNNSNSGNRNGRIESVNLSACAQFTLVCCDANVCPQDTLCENDPAVNIVANTPGGTWGGPGMNPTTGVFDPASAGAGLHTITYTLACGSDQIEVFVDPCTVLDACLEANGDITITNGTGPFVWEEWVSTTVTPTTEAECTACGGNWSAGFPPFIPASCDVASCTVDDWATFGGTTATQTPSGNAPYQVTDGLGSTVTIANPATLPACSSTCTPPDLGNFPTHVTCAGGSDGAIDLVVTGTSTYDFAWSNGETTEDISGLPAGTYSVTVTDQSDPSCTATATIIINDGTTPPAPTAGTDATYCNGDPMVDLTATAGSGGTLNWYSDAGLTTNIGTGTTLTPGTTIGATTYYVTETVTGCESPASSVTITINDNPVITAENSADITNCLSPDGSITITSNGTSYELFTSAGVSVSTNATGSFTGLAAGDYYVEVSLNGCMTTSSTFTIANASAPAAPVAGTDATYCVGDAMIDLTATAGAGGTLNWYSDAGLTTNIGTGGTLTPGTTQGATTYYVTETVTGCESPASSVTITINVCCDLDVSTVVTDETCDGLNDGSVAFTINGSGTYDVIIDGTTEFNDVMAGAQNWIGQADGTYAVQVVDINDPACDTTFNITINPGALITITSESSTDITDCVNPDGTFTVTATGATSYELYTAAGGLVATNATGSFTGLNAGDYYVIATDGTCTGQSSTLTINNASAPAAPVAGTDATYCDGDLIADLTATVGSGGTLTWYDDAGLTNVVGGGTTYSPNNTVGTTIYYVTETVSGCESASSAVTITINAIPGAPTAGTDATYCVGDPMVDLTTTATNPNWYSDAGLTTNIGSGSTLTPGATVGTTTYYVTETSNGCESVAAQVNITINDLPAITAEASTDITDCLNPDGTVTITSNGTSYELFDAGNNSVSTNATGSFTGLNAGDYYVVVTLNGCSTTSSTLTINNALAPAAPVAGTDATYCDGDAMIDLSATAGSGGTLNWYSDAGLTTNIGTGTSLTPGATIGATTYYVTETVSGCESPSTAITITINPVPAAPVAGTDATYCLGDALADMTATAGSGGTLNWYDDMGLTNNIGSGTTLAPNNTVGATVYYVTESLGACESASSMVTITINDAPTITAEDATDLTDCTSPNGTITITSNGTSYELFDSGNNSIATNATGSFTGLGAGDYYVVVSNGNCTTTGATLTIVDQTQSSSSTQNVQACSGSMYTFADGTQQMINGNTSYVSTLTNAAGCDSLVTENITAVQATTTVIDTSICEGGNYTSVGDAANFVNVLADFQHTSTLTGASGCDSIIIENVTVIPAVTIDLGSDFTACYGETITITANANAGSPLWNTGDTTSSITITVTSDTTFFATVTDICGSATDTINISVSPAPDVDAGPDVTIPLGMETDLEVTSSVPGVTFEWMPGTYLTCDDCPNPTAGPQGTITYVVSGTDENGCVGYDTITVVIDGEVSIYIPNIFSPNNDGENDIFKVYGPTWKNYRMEIYNRWGGLIFLSEDPNVEWDGTHYKNGEECPQAVFVYKFWGVSTIGMTFERAGNVMLTR